MAIQPIDLQTLFLQMNQVSKEQAAEKDAEAVSEATKAEAFIKKSEEDSTSVVQTSATEEGVERVKDGMNRPSPRSKKKAAKKEAEAEPEAADGDEDGIFKDPNLGHHIDISG